MSANKYQKVGTVDDIDPGKGMGVTVDGIEIAVFNVDGEFYAISNRCAHQQAPLCKAGERKIHAEHCWTEERGGLDTDAGSVYCPWHLWEWDLETGRNPITDKRIGTFDVKVDGEDLLVGI